MLDPNWDASTDAYTFVITDDDSLLEGDAVNNEIGDDASQSVVVTDGGGGAAGSGQIYLEQRYSLTDPDGNIINLYAAEIGGAQVGWISDGEIVPGIS